MDNYNKKKLNNKFKLFCFFLDCIQLLIFLRSWLSSSKCISYFFLLVAVFFKLFCPDFLLDLFDSSFSFSRFCEFSFSYKLFSYSSSLFNFSLCFFWFKLILENTLGSICLSGFSTITTCYPPSPIK